MAESERPRRMPGPFSRAGAKRASPACEAPPARRDLEPEVPTPAVPTPEMASLAEDFIDIFFSPSAVFARRANSGFFAVMCILTLLLGGLFLANRGVMQGIMDAEFARGMAAAAKANPAMTEAQMETAKKSGDSSRVSGHSSASRS